MKEAIGNTSGYPTRADHCRRIGQCLGELLVHVDALLAIPDWDPMSNGPGDDERVEISSRADSPEETTTGDAPPVVLPDDSPSTESRDELINTFMEHVGFGDIEPGEAI